MPYITRTIEPLILQTADSFPCVAVYGPRQVGKTTTIDRLFGSRCRKVTLDDLDDRTLATQQPKLFLQTYGWPLIIDEIQKAPLLLDEIKKNIDDQRLLWMREDAPRKLMYILTGSNRFELQEGISESLAGRCGIIEMSSLSQAEKRGEAGALFCPDYSALSERERALGNRRKTINEIYEDIFQGGMPDIVTGAVPRDLYFRSYVNTYIEKDVRKLIAAGSELQFRNFLSILALRTAQEVHYDVIAADVGIDVRTCKRWISILQTSGIICLLHPYMANISNRIIKAPKLYFMDTGLCSYLCRWPSADMLQQCAMNGAFMETYAVSELVKNLQAHGIDPQDSLFYYRDIDQKEIDLLFVNGNTLHPIEIKTGSSPKRPAKNFGVLNKYKMRIGTGFVIDTCDKIRPITDNVYAYPIDLLGV